MRSDFVKLAFDQMSFFCILLIKMVSKGSYHLQSQYINPIIFSGRFKRGQRSEFIMMYASFKMFLP